MRRIAKTLIAGTALLTLTASPLFADDWEDEWEDEDSGEAEIINGQLNFGPVWSQINVSIDGIEGDVSGAASAVGNAVNIVTLSNTVVENDQANFGDVGAEVNAEILDIGGDVILTATAVCNAASISTDPDSTSVTSNQSCGADDPSATINADISNVAGGVGLAAIAVGNQIEVDSNANSFPINSFQENISGSFASVNANISGAGAVDLSATAVGNSATFVHY